MQLIKNHKIIRYLLITLTINTFINACTDKWLDEKYENNPICVFDAIWDDFDKVYGAFEAKHINWDSCRMVYRSKLSMQSTDSDLYIVLCSLLKELNDGHVQLMAPNFKRCYSSKIYPIFPDSKFYENSTEINLLFNLIRTRYVMDISDSGSFFYGFISLQYSIKKVGYIYVPSFQNDVFPEVFVRNALKEFESKDGIIVDLRFNSGGTFETYIKFLNYFTDRRRIFLKSKIRNGPKHTDFTDYINHYMNPAGLNLKNKPIVVITNRFTASSAEHVVLGLKALPWVTIIGDTTFGAFSTVIEKLAPNGWQYRNSPQVLYDTLGNLLTDSKGRYLDGIGISPDEHMVNYISDIRRAKDKVLNKAIAILELKVK